MRFRLALADAKHMTLNQLEAVMTPAEMLLWQAFYDMREEDRQKEARS